MSDLIDRQAAIDAIRASTSKYTGFMELEMYTDDDAVEAIEGLPSVQPQPVRCKDCKWCDNVDGSVCKNPASWVVATDRDFGCVLAERKQDANND